MWNSYMWNFGNGHNIKLISKQFLNLVTILCEYMYLAMCYQ